ncbi:MAG: ComEC/Rec2 family competence protein [Alphaproteobacteria bacterium]
MTLTDAINLKTTARGAFAGLGSQFHAERERWPLWAPVFFAMGIAAYFSMSFEPSVWAGVCAAVFAVAILLLRRNAGNAFLPLAVLAIAGLGFAAAQYRTASVAAPVLKKAYGPAVIAGRVVHIESFPAYARIWIDRLEIPGLSPDETPKQVRVRLYRAEMLSPGMRVTVFAKLSPPSGPAAPGEYDFRRRAWFEQLGGVGFALGAPRPVVAKGDAAAGSIRIWISDIRRSIGERIRTVLPGASGGVAVALITGDRSGIPADVIDAMRDSGLAHLLAISGLHMGLVAGFIFFGLRTLLALSETLALNYPIKKWAAVAALLGSAGYLALAGATVPTQRAFLMTGLVLMAVLFDRTAISLRLVAWAAAFILIVAPESLLGASFQMSFAAVVALVSVYEQGMPFVRRRPGRGWGGRMPRYIGGVALTTLIAGAATGLIALYHFGRIAHFGLAANIVAVPVTALWIMPWAVVSVALMPFGLEGLALVPMEWGVALVIHVARGVADWPGAVSLVPAMPVWGLACIALGGLWLCLWRRRWRYFGIAGIAAGLASIPAHRAPDILVSDDGGVMAVRDAEGELIVNNVRRGRRTARSWLENAGQLDVRSARDPALEDRIACDALGCIAHLRGKTVALVEDPRALSDDCRRAEIVVSAVPVRGRCASARIVVDRFDLWRHGAHAIRIGPEGEISVETVADYSGNRPWTPERPDWRRKRRDQ